MKTQLFHCSKWKYKKHYPFEETATVKNILITKSISRLWAWSIPHSRAILRVSQERQFFFPQPRTLETIQLFSQHTLFLHNNASWKQRIQNLCTITLTLFCRYSLQEYCSFSSLKQRRTTLISLSSISLALLSVCSTTAHFSFFKEPWIFFVWAHKSPKQPLCLCLPCPLLCTYPV